MEMKNWIIKNRNHLLIIGAGLAALLVVAALRPAATLAELQAARDSVFAKQNPNQVLGKETK